MPGGIAYLDSSALVKLVVEEQGSAELRAALADWPRRVSSSLAEVEVVRALRQTGGGEAVLRQAEDVLAQLHLIDVDAGLRRTAAMLDPRLLRSLDAIHLASALSIGSDLKAFVAYDRRLLDAARVAGLPAVAPGSR